MSAPALDVWHLYECENPRCKAKQGPQPTGVVVQIRVPPYLGPKGTPGVACPVCGETMHHEGRVLATESGHFPARGPTP